MPIDDRRWRMYRILYWPSVEIVAKSLVGHGGLNPPMTLAQVPSKHRNWRCPKQSLCGLGFLSYVPVAVSGAGLRQRWYKDAS